MKFFSKILGQTLSPFAAQFRWIDLQATGSISLKSTCLAEAIIAAIPAIPDPEAKSKTLLFLTSDGLSKI